MKKLHFLILFLLCAATTHAQMTDVQLGQAADTIHNETVRGANTAKRIGRMFNNIIDNKVNVNTLYSNPSFVNTLAWNKITGTPTTLAGYGITDGGSSDKRDAVATYKTKTASHTLDAADLTDVNNGKYIVFIMNVATDHDFTVVSDATLDFPDGTIFAVRRIGAGLTTTVAGSGASASGSAGVLTDPGQYVTVLYEKISANTWLIQNGAQGTLQSWTPSFTGFSVNPTSVEAKYSLIGKNCRVQVIMAAGTSNSTSTTVTLPFAATSEISRQEGVVPVVVDNGVTQSTPGRIIILTGSNTATIAKTSTGAATWTASGSKFFYLNFEYHIQ